MKVYELLNKIGWTPYCDIVVIIFDEYDLIERRYDITQSMLERPERVPYFCKIATLDYFDIVGNQLKIYGKVSAKSIKQ